LTGTPSILASHPGYHASVSTRYPSDAVWVEMSYIPAAREVTTIVPGVSTPAVSGVEVPSSSTTTLRKSVFGSSSRRRRSSRDGRTTAPGTTKARGKPLGDSRMTESPRPSPIVPRVFQPGGAGVPIGTSQRRVPSMSRTGWGWSTDDAIRTLPAGNPLTTLISSQYRRRTIDS
jgi:hypothetical protein